MDNPESICSRRSRTPCVSSPVMKAALEDGLEIVTRAVVPPSSNRTSPHDLSASREMGDTPLSLCTSSIALYSPLGSLAGLLLGGLPLMLPHVEAAFASRIAVMGRRASPMSARE